ncbi:hypothetical protein [Epinotia aporema granulovirus]|uniref:Uncharacterized protein n=1 Tax=Epinotia aporema granulovirus TaxID=166056 RepID=K4EQT1_9BBAC|nr:hypothetical protein [Epinotia aporema granulovirus]AER41476.1 hypothetical protein [Epinotia aporema granulovirus]
MKSVVVDAKEFAKQLITDKCRNLIESENLLPEKVMDIIRKAHDEYNECPNEQTFKNIKELICQTKYVEESVEYKNFNRGTFLIAVNLIVNKCRDYLPEYRVFFENMTRRLDKIDPDMKASPKDMLKHYYECIENLDSDKTDEHYMVSYAKSVLSKILYDTVADMTGNNAVGAVVIPAATAAAATKTLKLSKKSVVINNNLREKYTTVTPLFLL